jgi:hypothetical protein
VQRKIHLREFCDTWAGPVNAQGYPVRRGRLIAHELWAGVHGPVPKGRILIRLCGNRRCTNIEHLKLGTLADALEARTKRTSWTGTDCHKAKLTPPDVQQIRALHERGIPNTKIAKLFGVSIPTIGVLLKGKTWKSVL